MCVFPYLYALNTDEKNIPEKSFNLILNLLKELNCEGLNVFAPIVIRK